MSLNPMDATLISVVETLRNNDTIADELLYIGPETPPEGIIKVFAHWVDPDIPLPYIVVTYYSGGLDNDAQSKASDVIVKVTAHVDADLALCATLAGAIHTSLADQVPYSDELTGVGAYTAIEEIAPFVETFLRQNRPYHQHGGLYRVRLSELTS